MSDREPGTPTGRRTPSLIVAVLVVVSVAVIGLVSHPLLVATTSSATSPTVTEPRAHRVHDSLHRSLPGTLGEADGVVDDGASVFDDGVPAVVNLDPGLLEALRRAATDAVQNGVVFRVNSGWRSAGYQERLLHEAVSDYGSEEEARRWVATPETSAHVSGDAVDIGPSGAADWLSDHGGAYGLCRIYRNEPWHYELRPDAIDRGCPSLFADPSQDPRMQR